MLEGLTKEEKKVVLKKHPLELEKEIKRSYWEYWKTDDNSSYLKSYSEAGYYDGIGLKSKDGQRVLKIPRLKLWLTKTRWYQAFFCVVIGALLFFFCYLFLRDIGDIKHILSILPSGFSAKGKFLHSWNGPVMLILCLLAPPAVWIFIVTGIKVALYPTWRQKQLHAKSAVDIQSENIIKNRAKYGTLQFEDIIDQIGPGKKYNITVYDDPKTLNANLGWLIKAGVTNDPTEISIAKKGYFTSRMWTERPKDIINPLIEHYASSNKVTDKSYVMYAISISIDKLHVFNEGSTGSGKTQCYVKPETIHILRNNQYPSLLLTCKSGDEQVTVNQAKCLDIPVKHIQLDAPGKSIAYNPLFIPYLYHKMGRQLKYGTVSADPVINHTPYEYEQQYDIEIRKKGTYYIESLKDISSKEDLIKKLGTFTHDEQGVDRYLKGWEKPTITLFDMCQHFKNWENKDYVIMNISKHFLFSPRLEYWTEERKKTASKWYRYGNWIFESRDEYNNNRERLISTMDSSFSSAVDSVITNVLNEEKNPTQDAFWTNQVRIFLRLFIRSYFDIIEMGELGNHKMVLTDTFLNIPALCEWLSFYGQSVKKMQELADPFLMNIVPTIKSEASQFHFSDNTFSSIQGSINAVTQYYNLKSPLLPIISRNDFNPLEFGIKQMLMVITTDNDSDALANILLKDIAGQLMGCCNFIMSNYRDKAGQATMPRPVRFVIDEAGSGAPIPWSTVNAIATKGRSQRVLEDLYYQTNAQVKTQYPKEQGALDILLDNLQLKRCIKSSAEDSLRAWESILGRGIATSKSSIDKKEELAGAGRESPYFNADFIRNKPDWNVLIKSMNDKTMDVSSCPIFPTHFQEILKSEAEKHKTNEVKSRGVTAGNYHQLYFIPFQEILNELKENVKVVYNFCVMFINLVVDTTPPSSEQMRYQNAYEDQSSPSLPPFAKRFSPQSVESNINIADDVRADFEQHKKERISGPAEAFTNVDTSTPIADQYDSTSSNEIFNNNTNE